MSDWLSVDTPSGLQPPVLLICMLFMHNMLYDVVRVLLFQKKTVKDQGTDEQRQVGPVSHAALQEHDHIYVNKNTACISEDKEEEEEENANVVLPESETSYSIGCSSDEDDDDGK